MKVNFNEKDGLAPVIVQHYLTNQVLMLGYVNEVALQKTIAEGKVVFYSRSKQKLWTKGETSGNYLYVQHIQVDCDADTVLIKVLPAGPTCHTGADSCFKDDNPKGFLYQLEQNIQDKTREFTPNSYTWQLFSQGINKVAQKVGEEAVELIIEAKDSRDDLFKSEAADLLYHFLLLLRIKNVSLSDVEAELRTRSLKQK